jgi:nucleoside 2-deoxyribosyltransferase
MAGIIWSHYPRRLARYNALIMWEEAMIASKVQRLTIFICAVIICSFTGNVSADQASEKDTSSRRPLIYLAGPLGFSEPGKQYQDNVLIPELIRLGYRVFDPWQAVDKQELADLYTIPPGQERVEALRKLDEKIGLKNATAIEECDIVFAVLDGADVDSGTAAELGFAAAKNKPIVGYRSDFRLSGDNEGTMINLQVEHFIRASGGTIVKSLVEADSALSNTIGGQVFQNPTIAPSQTSGPAATPGGIVNPDAAKVVIFFNSVFTIVLALALGEAFKQFVADKAIEAHDRIMHWNRLPALIIFLVTIIPFFEGMTRYFDFRYNHIDMLLKLYPGYLLLDAIMFLAESFLFFVLARALSPAQIERTIYALLMLFAIDLVRDVVDRLSPIQEFGPWFKQNIADVSGLVIVFVWYKIQSKVSTSGAGASIVHEDESFAVIVLSVVAVLSVISTFYDYYSHWTFYFPPLLIK